MNPWDEEWSDDSDVLGRPALHVLGEGRVLGCKWDQDDPRLPALAARVKLASAAPELARALLSLSRTGVDRSCVECNSAGEDGIHGETSGSCTSDCELDAALRKAGIR